MFTENFMSFDEASTYYDILDLKPDASPQEVRDAYLRTKSAYNKDSLALYTLVSPQEREEMIQKIEEAYTVLSSPERRKEYDANHGLMESEHDAFHRTPRGVPQKKIISIDRVPPMENSSEPDHLLVAPSTDIGQERTATHILNLGKQPNNSAVDPFDQPDVTPLSIPSTQQVQPPPPSQGVRAAHQAATEMALSQEINQEVEWRGSFLKKIRETRRISIEEMAAITKITRTYLFAIEDENYPKLPAAVYLRGFLVQIAKALRLPYDKVATAYMARYYQARPEQMR